MRSQVHVAHAAVYREAIDSSVDDRSGVGREMRTKESAGA